jgi:hypothetical protein
MLAAEWRSSMTDLGLAKMQRWIGGTLLTWKEFFVGPSPANSPPSLPFRCGTMMMDCSPEARERVFKSWAEDEDRFIAWVAAHSAPRAEWLKDVERLRRRR